jgi:DNA-binding NarL/FixJ family response regulator
MPTLSPRQIELVRHLAQGQRSKEIAADLHLQMATVNGYVAEIRKK